MAPSTSLSQAAIDALPYWSAVRNAAATHRTTQQLWESIRALQAEYGTIGSGPTVQGISALRGIAGQIERTSREFEALADNKGTRGLTITRAPWARSPGQQRADPRYQVSFLHTFQIGEEQSTQWRSVMFDGRLPRTVGELREQLDQDIESMSDDYDVEHIGASNFQIMSV